MDHLVRRGLRVAVSGDVLLHRLAARSDAGHSAMLGFTDGAILVTPGAIETASRTDSGSDIVRVLAGRSEAPMSN
jgi:hypothetical protein